VFWQTLAPAAKSRAEGRAKKPEKREKKSFALPMFSTQANHGVTISLENLARVPCQRERKMAGTSSF
jgi:uncharacterized protein YdhG (YjbR/CyaY superfamily)